ncbi:sugar transferase [Pollutimonas thiosulfatoxidans]|uniref:Sugar transferase n=1 Tax=Pollutimonas thiosulfatoxidans TaxID=2028345 RepID=A0A410GEL9_9BURK|nr:sugar transferase [Pollutimonas thiosulfatoxidans]QAA94705.1 sugar transferase [Pollutimonas thiosulfatoxidans]
MKRLFDVTAAITTLLCSAPLLLAVAIIIYAGDRGPVIYRQTRVGQAGRTFSMLKFRSMVINAENLGGYATAHRDPRITRFGRVIRRTSIDELPQLLNVLMGHMSIVGPRPDVPQQRPLYSDEEWQLRTSVRPGLTGLAQVSGRSQATEDERKRLDLEYARTNSFKLDMKIIAMTVKQVVAKGGN